MKKTLSLNSFRRMTRQEETMMRAVMPRVTASDAAPLVTPITPGRLVVASVRGVRLVKPLTWTLAETV